MITKKKVWLVRYRLVVHNLRDDPGTRMLVQLEVLVPNPVVLVQFLP